MEEKKRNPAYLSIVDKPDDKYHRYPVILHRDWNFYLAEFWTIEQLEAFAKRVGFTYTLQEERRGPTFGLYRQYSVDRRFEDRYFWTFEELPDGAKPIKGHSNGSIVTCFFTNDGETITFWRPNPNAKVVWNPLPIDEHIRYNREHGGI